MFVYLSKKIAIPNNTQLHCVSWNKQHGYIACGGEDGLLKVLKLESDGATNVAATGTAALSNLSMNQTLEGHGNAVKVVTWNEGSQQKLTSSDQFGLIIVWMLYKGSWYEEMINNRNKSVVKDMKWNTDGQKICIVYEDGAVIVGSVDGNRIWGRELKSMALTNVEWSPDGRLLLFGVQTCEVYVFDNIGNHVGQIVIKCLSNFSGLVSIVGIEWYNGKGGFTEPNSPRLAICFSNGRLQIMQDESDTDPVLLDAGDIRVVSAQWNNNGSILAVAGVARFEESGINKECNVVQFYAPHGDHLRTLKVPGKQIADCSWDGGGLRLALAIDHFIYFANIRPNYKWCFFSNTVVYAFSKPDRSDVCVAFWDTKNNEHCIKYVKHLVAIAAATEYCVLSTRSEDDNDQFALVICNAIGTPVDSKYVDLTPTFLSMSSGFIMAASQNQVLIWPFSTPQSKSILNFVGTSLSDDTTDRLYHVDDIVSNKPNEISSHFKDTTDDPICCVCHSETIALVARESGIVYQCSLPNFTWIRSHNISCQPYHMAINCNSTRACVLDSAGSVMLFELENDNDVSNDASYSALRHLERKDVWDIKWSIDNSELFVLMEKTRMYVFRNTEPEEPTSCSGYICSFENLQVKTVLLDGIMATPDHPSPQMMVDMEVKSLRDTRELLDKVSTADAMTFVEDNPHPRLWRLLAEAALEKMELKVAETAFVKCKDLHAIRFVKGLHNVQSEKLRKAEIAAYCHKFDEAEKLYLENDRRDLAVALRRKLGDWFRVVQLLKSGSTAGNDALLEEAWNAIGDYFADRQKWESAVKYYEQGSNQERLAECYYALEDYANLETLANGLPEGNKLLSEIAGMFATLGMCEQAVAIYIKNGNTSAAIDCCISLHNWSKAVELAERFNIREIEPLLAKYSQHLLEKNKVLSAVELYRKAGGFIEATQLLYKIAKDGGKKKATPLHLKKLYVLAGLLVEEHRRSRRTKSLNKQVTSMISGLLEEESLASSVPGDKTLDSAWQGAEAYHFYLLAQRQLYDGYFEAAMKTALHLQDYENILDQEEIYLLLALTSSANRAFGTCSKAFIKLESLEDIPMERREIYENIAMDIFVKNSPKDNVTNQVLCPTCSGTMLDGCNLCPSCNSKYPLCTATGRPLLEPEIRWTCQRCKRCCSTQEMASRKTCPLCHASVSL